MRIELQILNDEHKGKKFRIKKFPVFVGRAPDNDIEIGWDTYVSRHHFSIWTEKQKIYIIDQGSTNKTYVNQREITCPTILNNGDIISIGKTKIKFHVFNSVREINEA